MRTQLTVRQLIAKLKRLPQHALVAWQNHDQNEDEIDGYVATVVVGKDVLHEARAEELEHMGADTIVVLGT